MNTHDPLVCLEKVSKRLGPKQIVVLDNISLSLERGEFVAMMGPSGSGKSTLLHILGCLDSPTSGCHYFEGEEVHTLSRDALTEIRNKKIGFVFQNFCLVPRVSALENVALPLVYAGETRKAQLSKSSEALEKVGLTHRAQHTPAELSGGEQQRVAIARALVTNPKLVLADEPTGNLDGRTAEEIVTLLKTLHEASGVTLILVTHDASLAKISQRTLFLNDGRIQSEQARS